MSTNVLIGNAQDTAPAPADSHGISRLGGNIAALASGQAVTWTMALLWTIVVPRALGPDGMGLIVTALSVTGAFGIILGLGTRNYLVREMVVSPDSAPRLIGTALVLRLALTPVFVVAIAVYAQVAHYRHDETVVLYLATAAAVLILLAEPLQAAFQAIERMKYLAYSDVIAKSSQGIVGILLVVAGFRAIGLTASSVAVAAVVVVLDVYWLIRYVRIDIRATAQDVWSLVRQSLAFWAMALFFMVYLWIDAVMLSLMTRPEIVGWYGVPTKLFQTLMFLPAVLSTAWLPRLVDAFKQGPDRLHEVSRKPIEIVALLGAPVCAGTVVVAAPLIHVLYGTAYNGAVPVLVILGLCIPPMYVNVMVSQVLIAAKRQSTWTWVMALATVINPAMNFGLIKLTQGRYGNGAIGAAVSLLITELIIVSIGIVLVRQVFDRHTVRRFVIAAFASGAMWLVAYVVHPFGTVLGIAAGVAAFFVIAIVFRLATADEVAFVRTKLRQLTARFA